MKILCYHGVFEGKNHKIVNFNNKHIKKKVFDKQMKTLKEKYNPISITQVYNNLKKSLLIKMMFVLLLMMALKTILMLQLKFSQSIKFLQFSIYVQI